MGLSINLTKYFKLAFNYYFSQVLKEFKIFFNFKKFRD